VYRKILSRKDWIVMSGVSWKSKTRVLMSLDKAHLQLLSILSFLAILLSMREARTLITNGVFESSWYE
jgi:hypothetical protein